MLDGSGGKTEVVWRFQIDTFFIIRVDGEKVALLNRVAAWMNHGRVGWIRRSRRRKRIRFFDFEYEAMRFPGFCLPRLLLPAKLF